MTGVAQRSLRPISEGEVIGAGWLNEHVETTNALTSVINRPRQRSVPAANAAETEQGGEDSTLQGELDDEPNPASDPVEPPSLQGEVWTELSRTTSTVRVFQDDDEDSANWVDVERVESLTFVVQTSAGQVVTRLVLDND